MTPHPGATPAAIAAKPSALRAKAFATTAAAGHSAGRSGNINTNNNRRQVGPLQAIAPGPVQAIVLNVESFNGRVRDELLDVGEFSCLAEGKVVIEDWRQDHNRNPPHSALGMLAPVAFAATLIPAAAGV